MRRSFGKGLAIEHVEHGVGGHNRSFETELALHVEPEQPARVGAIISRVEIGSPEARDEARPPDAGAIEGTEDGIEPSGPRPLTGAGLVAGIRASP